MTKLASLFTTGLLAIALAMTTACVGSPPDGSIGDDPNDPNNPNVVDGFKVSGTVVDYNDPAGKLSGFQVSGEGLAAPITALSADDGLFELGGIVEGTSVIPTVSPAPDLQYRPTINPSVLVGNTDLTANVYAISEIFLTQQLTNVGLLQLATDTTVVYAELVDDLGDPLVGVPAADIQLLDALGAPVVGLSGPYFIGANNQIHPTEAGGALAPILASEEHDGKVRVVFLNVLPGNHTLSLPNPADALTPYTASVNAVANGATIVRNREIAGGAADLLKPPPAGTLFFTTDIHPMLQSIADKGYGCTTSGCHNNLNAAELPILRFDKDATLVYTDMANLLGTIDIATPEESMIYSKPMRELVGLQNHPNFTCATAESPLCDGIMKWLLEGAPLAPPL